MLKLLIVDDEQKICSLIRGLVDWEGLALTDAGSAINGEQALRMIQEISPDIVLTDVRMPGMSGLELIERATALPNPPRFIIMSGYTQFEYAYTAVKFGVEDFLLKPLDGEELNMSLSRSAAKIADVGAARGNTGASAFLNKLSGGFLTQEALTVENCNAVFGCAFRPGLFLAGLLHIDYTNSPDSKLTNVELRIRRGLARMLEPLCHACLVEVMGNGLTFVLNYPPARSAELGAQMELIFREISVLLAPYDFARPTLATGTVQRCPERLAQSLGVARLLVDSRILMGTDQWLDGEAHPCVQGEPRAPEPVAAPRQLPQLLELLQFGEAASAIEGQWKAGKSRYDRAPFALRQGAIQYTLSILMLMKASFSAFSEWDDYFDSIPKALSACVSAAQLDQEMSARLGALMDALRGHLDTESQQIITLVRKYILAHLEEHIMLEDIAREVYLSPAYLGSLFRQKTGVTFTAYLTEVRMEQAKKYLRDPRYTIMEVGAKTGYRDAKHFSKVFRKAVGVKPTEYRKIFALYHRGLE